MHYVKPLDGGEIRGILKEGLHYGKGFMRGMGSLQALFVSSLGAVSHVGKVAAFILEPLRNALLQRLTSSGACFGAW